MHARVTPRNLGSKENEEAMSTEVFRTGAFAGVDVNDAFALAASRESPIVVDIGPISWPDHLAPLQGPLSNYRPGTKITEAFNSALACWGVVAGMN